MPSYSLREQRRYRPGRDSGFVVVDSNAMSHRTAIPTATGNSAPEDRFCAVRGLVAEALDRCGRDDRMELVRMLLEDAASVLDEHVSLMGVWQ